MAGLLKKGAIIASSKGTVAVATTSTTILAAESSRSYAIIINDSDTVIYLNMGSAAVVGQGIRINANGGAYEMTQLNMSTSAIYGIHGGSGNKNVSYLQGKVTI